MFMMANERPVLFGVDMHEFPEGCGFVVGGAPPKQGVYRVVTDIAGFGPPLLGPMAVQFYVSQVNSDFELTVFIEF